MKRRPAPHCASCCCGASDVPPTNGVLQVGLTHDESSVVLNHPQIDQDELGGYLIFSPQQARHLGELLMK